MLNLTPSNQNPIAMDAFESLQGLKSSSKPLRKRFVYGLLALLLIVLFLPWTQTIQADGTVSTLRPEQRPQEIQSLIAGRIEKWYVKDGDFVRKGDTILFISEIKESYFDPQLVGRSENQLKNKELSVRSYSDKVRSLDQRIDALIETGKLKLQQATLKIKQTQLKLSADSIEYSAGKLNYQVAKEQFERFEKLHKEGLKSLTELETRKVAQQRAQASMLQAQQKWMQSRNEISDARMELNAIETKFQDEVAKAESDKFTALSSMYEAEVEVSKLQSQVTNYSIRNGMYYVLAPQDGRIACTLTAGLGQTVKAGSQIASIMPSRYDHAVELFVRPMDMPLVHPGQVVRLQFDGWPALVFSGWPNSSLGSFPAKVLAIDQFTTDNGMFRLLVVPVKGQKSWPKALRVGGGAKGIMLLKTVPVWYEFWRVINGFPPDFYTKKTKSSKQK
ncbi:MAG: hypothetical protein RLZZ301_366 [Bacteroidota bacterium]